jgi:hypothetical protein
MKDFPMRYRDANRVNFHIRLPMERMLNKELDRSLSIIQQTLFLNMLLDPESKLFLASGGKKSRFVPLFK